MKHNSLVSILRPAIESLNHLYGKGDVITIALSAAGLGSFQQKPFNCRSQWRKFSILQKPDGINPNQITVYALGHQKTIAL